MAQVHRQHLVAPVSGTQNYTAMFAPEPECGCTFACFRAKTVFFAPVDRHLLDGGRCFHSRHTSAFLGIAFGVFVRQTPSPALPSPPDS